MSIFSPADLNYPQKLVPTNFLKGKIPYLKG